MKLNCVVMRGENDDEIQAFAQLTLRDRAVFHVRFIEVMPVHENLGACSASAYMSSSDEILERRSPRVGAISPGRRTPRATARLVTLRLRAAARRGRRYQPALRTEFCERCNRVRPHAPDGRLRLCLFGDQRTSTCAPRCARGPARAGWPRSWARPWRSSPSAITWSWARPRAGCARFRRSAGRIGPSPEAQRHQGHRRRTLPDGQGGRGMGGRGHPAGGPSRSRAFRFVSKRSFRGISRRSSRAISAVWWATAKLRSI